MRSVASMFVDMLLVKSNRKETLADPTVFEKRVETLLKEGETPYILNYNHFNVSVAKKTLNNMDYYVLNADNHKNANKIMYFHGGGFISQPVTQHWQFLNKIAKETETEIWVPIYPKVPFHDASYTYPLLIDLYCLFAESVKNGNIIFMGDSAGGNLVLGMAQRIQTLPLKQPSSLIMISPFLDVSLPSPESLVIEPKDVMLGCYGTRRCGELWAGDLAVDDPQISPFYGDLTGLGKMTIFTGTYDIVNPDSRRFLTKAEKLQISVNFHEEPKLQHVYPLLPTPEARKAIREIESIVTGG